MPSKEYTTPKCFFCDKQTITPEAADFYPQKVVQSAKIGNKIICQNCAVNLYDLISTVDSGTEDFEYIPEEALITPH